MLCSFAAALLLCMGADVARADYALKVKSIRIRGKASKMTDAAQIIVGEKMASLKSGASLPAGASLRILYPKVQVRLDDGGERSFLVECDGCTEATPAVLTVGDPKAEKPFRQEGGRLTVKVGPEKNWFKMMYDTVRGPEEKLVPLAVEGTFFIVEESKVDDMIVSVVTGVVAVGTAGSDLFRRIPAGQRMRMRGPKMNMEPLPPAAVKAAKALFPVAVLKNRKEEKPEERPEEPEEIGSHRAPFGRFLQFLLIGGGVTAVGAGLVLHYKSETEDDDLKDERWKTAKYCYIGGGAAIALGFTWVLLQAGGVLADRGPERRERLSPLNLSPTILPGGMGWSFYMRF